MPWDRSNGTHPKYRTPTHTRYTKQLKAELKAKGYLTCTAPTCLFPTRYITNPNGRDRDGLHAGHEPDGVRYAGPQHNACNVRDGAKRGRAKQGRRVLRATALRW